MSASGHKPARRSGFATTGLDAYNRAFPTCPGNGHGEAGIDRAPASRSTTRMTSGAPKLARRIPRLSMPARADRRFDALLLAPASIVWWTNASGEFVVEQPSWREYTGQTWEEYRGSAWVSCLHPD